LQSSIQLFWNNELLLKKEIQFRFHVDSHLCAMKERFG